MGFGFLLFVSIIPVIGCLYLPRKYPEQYALALFRIKPSILFPCIWLAIVTMVGQVLYVMKGLPTNLQIAEGVIIGLSILYVNIVGSRMKQKINVKNEV